jgi:hypothetical protein
VMVTRSPAIVLMIWSLIRICPPSLPSGTKGNGEGQVRFPDLSIEAMKSVEIVNVGRLPR